MKALSLTIQKLWPMLRFLQTNKQTDRQTGQKLYPPQSTDARALKQIASSLLHLTLSHMTNF